MSSYHFYRFKRIVLHSLISFLITFTISFLTNGNELRIGVELNIIIIYGISFGLLLGLLDDFFKYTKLSQLNYIFRTIIKILAIPAFIFIILYAIDWFFIDSSYTLIEQPDVPIKLANKGFIKSVLFNVYLAAFLITIFNEIFLILGDNFIFDYIVGNLKGPIKEPRIFMFMDLKDSTTIAEEIGDIHFYELLNDCYTILGISSIKHNAEIVKYVGDEAILTWKYKNGIANNNCIDIFDDFKTKLGERSIYFNEKYGFMPRFTASAHAGSVVTAYLGSIKRQKDYSGDVMNTTARIEGLNNQFKSELLISEILFDMLNINDAEKIESILLKGKAEPINIYKIY